MTKKVKNQILYNLHFLRSCGFEYSADIKFSDDNCSGDQLPQDLDSLEGMACNCNLCELSKNKSNTLFGTGNKDADIMFIGDFPSISEDESGIMLSGKYGQMLINIVQNVLQRPIENVYVTNIFKCRKGDIKINSTIVHHCIGYLKQQINLISPKVIVLLGSESYKYFFDKQADDINILYGQFEEYNGAKLITTYHPAFLVRNPSYKKSVMNDMIKVKTYLESI